MACSHLSKLVQDFTDSVGMYIYKEGGESNENGLLINLKFKLLKDVTHSLYPSPFYSRYPLSETSSTTNRTAVM